MEFLYVIIHYQKQRVWFDVSLQIMTAFLLHLFSEQAWPHCKVPLHSPEFTLSLLITERQSINKSLRTEYMSSINHLLSQQVR